MSASTSERVLPKLEASLQSMLKDRRESKVAAKKRHKKNALLDSAYELFTSKGFSGTTIRDISHNAGVAKGTFYLYFEDKESILDELTRRHAGRLLTAACTYMEEHIEESREDMDLADRFIFIIDYLVSRVEDDKDLLKLVSKELTRGLFRLAEHKGAPIEAIPSDDDESIDFESYIEDMLKADGVMLRDLRLFIFTLLNLVNSTCYDILIYNEPVTLEEYKPYLNDCVRLLVNNAIQR